MNKNGKIILVVEDEKAYQKTLKEKLTNEGYSVILAKDGQEGFSLAVDEKPDLIMLDLRMPKIDGMTMLRNLRNSSDWGKEVPVFILTVLTSADDTRMKDVTELQPTYYFEKSSISLSDLVDKVKEIIVI